MSTSHWQYFLGLLFTVGFLAALLGVLFLSADKIAVSTIIAVTAGGLVLIAALPQIAEFSIGIKGVEGKLSRIEIKVDEQQKLINKLVEASMSARAFRHHVGITILHEYKYWQNETVGAFVQREFYHLKDRGYIGPETIEFDDRLDGVNIVGKAIATEIGRIYIALRKDDVPMEWLAADPEARKNLKVDAARALGLKVP